MRVAVLFLREPKKFKFIQAFREIGDLTAIGSLRSREKLCVFLFGLRERRLFNDKGNLPHNQAFFGETADLRSKTMIFMIINTLFLT
jgi:hypothetical protein